MPARKSKTERRLLGTWRSDRRRTLLDWRFKQGVTRSQRERLATIFGKLTLTYTGVRVRGVYGDQRFTRPYEVLASDSDSVAICYYDSVTEEWRIQHIHFEGDRYWIALGPNREWFRKVKVRMVYRRAIRRALARKALLKTDARYLTREEAHGRTSLR